MAQEHRPSFELIRDMPMDTASTQERRRLDLLKERSTRARDEPYMHTVLPTWNPTNKSRVMTAGKPAMDTEKENELTEMVTAWACSK